mgnify:CR=1 FL=1
MIEEFNKNYKDSGGLMKLIEMRALLYSQEYIATHFGVTKERVRQWMWLFFGEKYDPRVQRKNIVIKAMVDFARTHPIKDFYAAFRGKERSYYQAALQECYKKKIYRKK